MSLFNQIKCIGFYPLPSLSSLLMHHPFNFPFYPRYPFRYDRNGPYDVLIDGANVAFYGQNREGGGFKWPQIMSMVDLVKRENPGKKIMLVGYLVGIVSLHGGLYTSLLK